MNPTKRMLPARDILRRVYGDKASDVDVSGIDMMLHLINVVDIIRGTIFEELRKETGLSEGKFALLMILRDLEKPLTIGTLSERAGVAPATVSVMISRMLQAKDPLITRTDSSTDGRASLITLSAAGNALLDQALPAHFKRVSEFAHCISGDERERLIELLQRLTVGTDSSR